MQVVKAARKNKGARVTSRISLPGRYLVLVPDGQETGVSKRIIDEEERKRLRFLAKKQRVDGEGFGVSTRTAAEGVDEETLTHDLHTLVDLWREIRHDAQIQAAPCLI